MMALVDCSGSSWNSSVSTTPMDSVTVPTGETQSITFFLDLLVEMRYPALLVGLGLLGALCLALAL